MNLNAYRDEAGRFLQAVHADGEWAAGKVRKAEKYGSGADAEVR